LNLLHFILGLTCKPVIVNLVFFA